MHFLPHKRYAKPFFLLAHSRLLLHYLCWYIAAFLSALLAPVDHWNSVKSLEGVRIASPTYTCMGMWVLTHRHETNKMGNHLKKKQLHHSATRGPKPHKEPLNWIYWCASRGYGATEIPHRDHKNCDWSAWAACVCSNKFLLPVGIVESEEHMRKVKKGSEIYFKAISTHLSVTLAILLPVSLCHTLTETISMVGLPFSSCIKYNLYIITGHNMIMLINVPVAVGATRHFFELQQ